MCKHFRKQELNYIVLMTRDTLPDNFYIVLMTHDTLPDNFYEVLTPTDTFPEDRIFDYFSINDNVNEATYT